MTSITSSLVILFFALWHLSLLPQTFHRKQFFPTAAAAGSGGKWDLLLPSTGVSAMHMQLLYNDKVVMFDRTNSGPSNISLPVDKCGGKAVPDDEKGDDGGGSGDDPVVIDNCTAHSVEYDVASNSVRPLVVLSNLWCSSGSVSPSGVLVQTGGYGPGERVVRLYKPCNDAKCDWEEIHDGLKQRRWYATDHVLPDSRQVIVGGRRAPTYEFYPKTGPASGNLYNLPFLARTNDAGAENNLYPFVFVNVDGNLFIFANNRAIMFDYIKNRVVREYPEVPGGDPRCYPSSGSAVLLPLKNLTGPTTRAEVLVCGGSPKGAFQSARRGKFVRALDTCARITITDPNPHWIIEVMPFPRVMGDMVTLPNAEVLIINGAGAGTAGWELGRNPVLNPVLYRPENPIGSRFERQNPTKTPRLYHSTAILVRDGRVLVAGSNPNSKYQFSKVLFPTELSLEAFSPSYLDPRFDNLRPRILSPDRRSELRYGESVSVRFEVPGAVEANLVTVTMVSPSFSTHSFSMNQRLLVLNAGKAEPAGKRMYRIDAETPGSGHLAPPGYYLLFVVHQGIPSEGIWVHIH
ncbi:hypothetical protein DM860_006513 [Cuscuta australis]|uniref:Galactose oxidase-like Early set domain-containing protein n=1 Tax=Cuscuta australis TaxID=267555 RepID=A0A328D8W7_9ASTE|nr:hypothetical protein DM860_006513 [Cuscuta australis]